MMLILIVMIMKVSQCDYDEGYLCFNVMYLSLIVKCKIHS